MANKRGPLPPVMSTEETRVKPPEADEEELPPEEPSWDSQRDETQLHTNSMPPRPPLDWDDTSDATPIYPHMLPGSPVQGPDDATRPIPRKTGARPALPEEPPDDATRPIQRKSSVRPALEEPPDDATRPIQRKSSVRPALQDPPDDATRPIPRKTGARPALQDSDEVTSAPPARRSGPGSTRLPAVPWEPKAEDDVALPTGTNSLPPIVTGPYTPPTAPSSPPVLSPSSTQPPRVPAAFFGATTQPNYMPDKPPVLAPAATEPVRQPSRPPSTVFTQPNYVSPPPAEVAPIVTAPHLIATPVGAQHSEPPGEELRTAFSNKAALIADLIKATFARRSYGTAPYRLRIDEPDGPSTGGGRQARQPISLVANLESAPAVVCGWVDVAKKESQLRSYAVVAKRHKHRYGADLDITEDEYERFLNELVDTLFYGGIKILVQVPDEQEVQQQLAQAQGQAQPQPQGSRSCLGTLLLLSLTFALGVGAGMNSERFAPIIEQIKALIGR
jgi:hypothetical protein